MRVEMILDIRARYGLSLQAPWEVRADGRLTAPPLRAPEEVIERLVRLGLDPEEARRRLDGLTDSAPYVEFEWTGKPGEAARE